MEISWIKLKTKLFDDEKIQLIEAMPEADSILIIWIKLLIQAGKSNANGFILLSENIPYTPEMLSTIFRRPLQIIRFALKTLRDLGMIEVTERNVTVISNWEKHQNIEGLDKVREQNRNRQNTYRAKKRLLQVKNEGSLDNKNNDVTLQSRDVTEQIKNKINTINQADDLFNEFWGLYPKKVSKKTAYKSFIKLNPSTEQFSKIIEALKNHISSSQWQKENGQFIPHASTWLNQERWTDETETTNDPAAFKMNFNPVRNYE